ncbi:multicopper oxidase family protein [Umezawaea sp. Da 62-37]|uniref:multicopper oxidase family protein n=1 Tax=Umezawaea sp. Da 62-37 TaxID=3075927 RepID=UPI0028F74EB1|nr:multicopper oxidase family protein [Umezawaea sp. Da 62-37]WNV87335.1 multicopper oxidase family protein [Umezawaea sp. Da 62-37]
MVTRRSLMKLTGLGGAVALLPAERAIAALMPTVTATPFSAPLPIPPVARPVRQTATTDFYNVAIGETTAEVFPGVRTKVFTYNGNFPAATIVARRGREVSVTHTNSLTAPTVAHLHGAHVAASSDGYPMDVINPGGSREYRYPNAQLGGTFWYHAHAHHTEAEQVYRGLAGFYLLKDDQETALGLPGGDYDVPLMVRDAHFDDAGQLVYVNGDFNARTTLLVNGKPQPYFQVAARKYRLRFVNGSNERAFRLKLADGSAMTLIGSDGGLLPAPITASSFDLWPGERVEVVVDFSRYAVGTKVVLGNDLGEVDSTKSVMRFDVVRTATDTSRVPSVLRALPNLGTATVTRDIQLKLDLSTGAFQFDGKVFDSTRVDQHIKLGTTEIWRITNADTAPAIPHNLHLHLVQFQVLDRAGVAVGGHETGLKDTVTVPPGATVRIKVRFDGFEGRYVYHCHMLDHSATGMMGQMEITR